MVLSLALLARDRGLPQPRAIVAFSPATDNCEDLPSHKANIKTDYMLTDAVSRGIADVLFDHKPTEEELKQYLLSPLYGNYEGIAPIHLSASVTETLYDDAVLLYDKLRREGHEVGFDEKQGVCHAYQIMTYMPEAKQTLNKVFTFIESIEKKQRG